MTEVYKNHILIIDDSCDSRILLKSLLEAKGYITEPTSNGAEALVLLNTTQRLPQAILLDLRMPVMDGLTFRSLQQAEPRIKDIPVIVMSGDDNPLVIQAKTNSQVLQKPLNISSLMKTIEDTLQ